MFRLPSFHGLSDATGGEMKQGCRQFGFSPQIFPEFSGKVLTE
jgi:hypothetical protein